MTDYCRVKVADYVPDPYYGGAQGFENVLEVIVSGDKSNGFKPIGKRGPDR